MRHRLHEPGSVFGPCEDGCEHKSCALEKAAAKQVCTLCEEPIGYNKDYQYIEDAPVHSSCVEPGEGEEEPPPSTSLAG